MSDLWRDYIALPEVRFAIEHWREILALLAVIGIALLIKEASHD